MLKEKLDTAEQDSQEKDHKYSKQEIEMQKKMATVTDEYKQQQELLEKLQHKGEKHNNYVHNYGSTTCVRIIIMHNDTKKLCHKRLMQCATL